ncbi:MAG: hypothetical protein CL610_07590 [Anaerolineaceae bacterium]|nr:hypothetical protein [Anaerolineaceae bacterium]
MTDPTISVVIPVYNGEAYLAKAIDSVLQQTYTDYELVIVDDGSTDTTHKIIQHYTETHPDVVRAIHQPNGGTASALNTGVRAARGHYIAWLSHDDRFLPTKLEQQMATIAANPQINGVYTDYSLINSNGRETGRVYAPWYPPEKMLRHFLQNVFINGSTLLIERRCLEDVGLFDESVRYAHDALMWVHVLKHCQLAHIAQPLTQYRVHSAQGTQKSSLIRRDNRLWLAKALKACSILDIFPELSHNSHSQPQNFAAAHLYLGDICALRYRQPGLAFRQYGAAVRVWPHWHNPAPGRMAMSMARMLLSKIKEMFKTFWTSNRQSTTEDSYADVYLHTWTESISESAVTKDYG